MCEFPYNPFTKCRIIERLASVHIFPIGQPNKATVAQIAIAWVAAQGTDVIPVIGARRRDRLAETLGSTNLKLTAADLATIERAVPKGAALGDRYPTVMMATLDSEK